MHEEKWIYPQTIIGWVQCINNNYFLWMLLLVLA